MNIKLLLFEKKITIKYLAKKCGISNYWMGQKLSNNNLSLKEIKIILDLLNCKFEDIF